MNHDQTMRFSEAVARIARAREARDEGVERALLLLEAEAARHETPATVAPAEAEADRDETPPTPSAEPATQPADPPTDPPSGDAAAALRAAQGV